MFAKLLEKLTGKDDLERVAYKGDIAALNAHLKIRPVFIPQRPRRFLDASSFSQDELIEQLRADSEQLSGDDFDPWILGVGGRAQLPVFSSEARMNHFAKKLSTELNKVFGLGCISTLLENVTKQVAVDVVILNPFSAKSWEIAISDRNEANT